jgi:HD superfamily phosphohydrolase
VSFKNVYKSVRDSVHGFVFLTPIEQYIVDKPEFQRLRFVLQQSTAFQVFPSNSTSRFSHSLGAAHLAGHMFVCAVMNASKADREHFLNAARELIESARVELNFARQGGVPDPLLPQFDSLIGPPFLSHLYPPISDDSSAGELLRIELANDKLPSLVVIGVLWQAIRLATLVHDLGHLPMSHLFEQALAELGRDSEDRDLRPFLIDSFKKLFEGGDLAKAGMLDVAPEPHEAIGCILFKNIDSPDIGSAHGKLFDIVASIAKRIVVSLVPSKLGKSGKKDFPPRLCVISAMHGLMAGSVDADRLDYSLRDPAAAAVEYGAINRRRLVRSIQFYRTARGLYDVCFDKRALPDIEFFFVQRYFAFRQIVSHHKVARSSAILRQIIRDVIWIAPSASGETQNVLRAYGFWNYDSSEAIRLGPLNPSTHRFGRFDDSWLRSFLFAIYRVLRADDTRSVAELCKGIDTASPESRLPLLIFAFLHRNIEACWSMCKCEADYLSLRSELRASLRKGSEKSRVSDDEIGQIVDVILRSEDPTILQTCTEHIQKACKESKLDVLVLVDRESIKLPRGKRPDDAVSVNLNGKISNAFACSPLMRSLDGLAVNIDTLRVFLIGPSVYREKLSETASQSKLRKAVVKGLANAARAVLQTRIKRVGKAESAA